jgi:O-Antigen ligase
MNYAARSGRSGDAYLALLSGVLLGYAMVGKGFAYLGIAPVYIGEIAFLTGIAIFWRTRCFAGVLTTLPALLLAATMAWVLLRTLPFIDAYGIDALRDSVIVMYGGFAFIVTALLLEDGRRVNKIVHYYGVFVNIYVPAIPFIFIAGRYMGESFPKIPGTEVPLLQLHPTDLAVHLAGATVFALVGLRKVTRLWLVFLLAGLVMVGAVARGPMLAEVLPITAATLLLGKWRQLALTFLAGLVVFSLAYAVEPVFFDYVEARSSDERSISTRQLVENVLSITGQGGEQTEGTKEWRLQWWDMIVGNTIFGPNFWTGRGFGLNIADADGFRTEHNQAPLRSPHNVQMTMLARAGVPGVTLWLGAVLSWLGMMMHAMRTALRCGQTEWAGLFLFLGCYVGSIIINASFDPVLEGPMQGVWFWSLIGFGIGSVMVYRSQHMTSPNLVANKPGP